MNTVSMETTWAFESSMDQLDSMSARGYGIGKRTHFHLFRWERNDWIHIVEIVILTILNQNMTRKRVQKQALKMHLKNLRKLI